MEGNITASNSISNNNSNGSNKRRKPTNNNQSQSQQQQNGIESDYNYSSYPTARQAKQNLNQQQSQQQQQQSSQPSQSQSNSNRNQTSTSNNKSKSTSSSSQQLQQQSSQQSTSQQQSQSQTQQTQQPEEPQQPTQPSAQLAFNSLPPASLQRYLSRYGLLEPQGCLSYHHAVFPVPPLPSILTPPLVIGNNSHNNLNGRGGGNGNGTSISKRIKSSHLLASREEFLIDSVRGNNGYYGGSTSNQSEFEVGTEGGERKNSNKRSWQEPKTAEFKDLSAYDHPQVVIDRLANKAKLHWDKKDSVKEGETLTNFLFALRMRAHTLRATPPG